MRPKSTPPSERRTRFRRLLLRWFRRHGRDLPWRRTRDPWAILVSEFMLQQTQVTRVEEFYTLFLKRYPTVGVMASSHPAQVRESWDGLGYYRRATNLHRLSQQVVAEHHGTIPSEPEALEQLPGVGRYTAGAVASFAYGRRVPAVDTNVARVIRRAFHPHTGKGTKAEAKVHATATALLPRRAPDIWAFNQAIMELGALVCTARIAKCTICPVRMTCATGKRRVLPQP